MSNIKFQSLLYDNPAAKDSLKNRIAEVCLAIIIICLAIISFDFFREKGFFIFVLFISMLIPVLLKFYCFFNYETTNKKIIGSIEFNHIHINWNNKIIKWDDVDFISIIFSTYRGEFLYRSKWDFRNNLSLGIDNEINIKTKTGLEFSGSYLIDSKGKISELRKILFYIIKSNSISLENARRMISPENYQEHQELKKYCN
jgi:hypothetical protein